MFLINITAVYNWEEKPYGICVKADMLLPEEEDAFWRFRVMLDRLWPRSLCIHCGLKSCFSYCCLWLNGAGLNNHSPAPGLIVDYEVVSKYRIFCFYLLA